MLKVLGQGGVLPPGSIAPADSLPKGKTVVTIESAAGENDGLLDKDGKPAKSENLNVRCVYANGFTRGHQTNSPADLAQKVIGQLRGRFGVTGEIKILSLPKELKAGATIELEV